ncbi:hypothetical protein [Methylomonas koyamae]
MKGIVITVPDVETRLLAIAQLRKRGFKGQIGTLCYHYEEEQELKRVGADYVIHPLVEAGNQLAKHMLGVGN